MAVVQIFLCLINVGICASENYVRNWSVNKSRYGSVGRATGYLLDDRDSRVGFPVGAGNSSLHHHVQNGSGAHPSSYPMGTGGYFPGGKAAEA
jgi:hypothetical protein